MQEWTFMSDELEIGWRTRLWVASAKSGGKGVLKRIIGSIQSDRHY